MAAAVNCAAAAVHSGQASCVAVYRGLAEATDGRGAYNKGHMGHLYTAHGMLAPAQVCAMRTQRMLEVDGVPRLRHSRRWRWPVTTTPKTIRARSPTVSRSITTATRAARLISEPLRLFDCSRENDGATAILVVSAERVGDYRGRARLHPVRRAGRRRGLDRVGRERRRLHQRGISSRSGEATVGRRTDSAAADVDVAQVYENFTGPAVASMIDHGLCPTGPAAGEVLDRRQPDRRARAPADQHRRRKHRRRLRARHRPGRRGSAPDPRRLTQSGCRCRCLAADRRSDGTIGQLDGVRLGGHDLTHHRNRGGRWPRQSARHCTGGHRTKGDQRRDPPRRRPAQLSRNCTTGPAGWPGGWPTTASKPGDRVGLLAPNALQWPVAALAIMKGGAVLVPLNARLKPAEIRKIADDAGLSAVIAAPSHTAIARRGTSAPAANSRSGLSTASTRERTGDPDDFRDRPGRRGADRGDLHQRVHRPVQRCDPRPARR